MKKRSIAIGSYRVATVKFVNPIVKTGNKMFALFDNSVEVGDYVVCETDACMELARVEVIYQKHDYTATPIIMEIVGKVDMAEYNKRRENEADRERVESEMRDIISQRGTIAMYEAIADRIPELKEKLNEYTALLQVADNFGKE